MLEFCSLQKSELCSLQIGIHFQIQQPIVISVGSKMQQFLKIEGAVRQKLKYGNLVESSMDNISQKKFIAYFVVYQLVVQYICKFTGRQQNRFPCLAFFEFLSTCMPKKFSQ
eukprot:TRINITY_DN3067_c0_g2_i12.p11 TRINITY_DN3067_c0_g2~~TRINITY_DN3067_c0_g2_i12.p11  ORF type:complete len:112 (-),score=3.68 TRINITY_DN3067_c0_g2_i12:1190-1525(-)